MRFCTHQILSKKILLLLLRYSIDIMTAVRPGDGFEARKSEYSLCSPPFHTL